VSAALAKNEKMREEKCNMQNANANAKCNNAQHADISKAP
jgi:hypothetical protein